MGHVFAPECWDGTQEIDACIPATPTDPTQPAPPPPTRTDIEAVVRTLVSRLELPDVTPHIGPDPTANQWKKAIVGHPLWLWTDAPTRITTTVTGYGITIHMDATRTAITYNLGDGTKTRCTTTTPYTKSVKPGTPSPTCGHTYQQPSPPHRDYTITATAHWNIAWTALGHTGTIPITYTDARTLPVGELQAVVIHR